MHHLLNFMNALPYAVTKATRAYYNEKSWLGTAITMIIKWAGVKQRLECRSGGKGSNTMGYWRWFLIYPEWQARKHFIYLWSNNVRGHHLN